MLADRLGRRGELAALPDSVEVHVLKTGERVPPRFTDRSQRRYRDVSRAGERIARAHEASARYLDEHGLGAS